MLSIFHLLISADTRNSCAILKSIGKKILRGKRCSSVFMFRYFFNLCISFFHSESQRLLFLWVILFCVYIIPLPISKWGFFLCVVLPHLYIFSYKKQTVIKHGLQRELLQCRMDSPPDILFFFSSLGRSVYVDGLLFIQTVDLRSVY